MENSEYGNYISKSDIITADSGKKIANDHSQENLKQMDFDMGFEHVANDNTFFQNDNSPSALPGAAAVAAPVPVSSVVTSSLIDVDNSFGGYMSLPKATAQNITNITKDFLTSEQSSSPDDSPVHYASPIPAPPLQQPAAADIMEISDTITATEPLIDQIQEDYLNPYSIPKHLVDIETNEKFISSEDLNTNYKDFSVSSSTIETIVIDDEDDDFLASGTTVKPNNKLFPTTDLDNDFKSSGDSYNVSESFPEPPPPMPKEEPILTFTEPIAAVYAKVIEPLAPKETTPVIPAEKEAIQPKKEELIEAEKMFKQIGLDAWFKPERLHPRVESLIYWRDVKKSAVVFGGGLAVLLAMSLFSLISVFAYASLITLFGTIAFRIYRTVLQAVQKTTEGHPFKDYLEIDFTLPQDKVQQIASVATTHVNAFIVELRRLFLVEDLIDSIKFGVLLWCLTYIGAIFNGMTCIIIAFVALFTLPKVYENNKQSIDAYIDLVRSKIIEITEKVKAAVPYKKTDSDKDK